ncbi:hypothetical protein [Amycolatopsis sp. WGS_07]|uniref:hypothetical protein n=1 Tax=Amycolatopsis sp. WGS_07 TaxID=3076764 RepID=UPI003873C756
MLSQGPAAATAPKAAPPTKAARHGLPGPNFDVGLEASEFHGWQKEIDTSPSVALQLIAEYANTGSVRQDNVTLRFELPPELVYQPGTARLGNGSHPDGVQTNDITGGMNIGSYAPGANAWVLFSTTLKDEKTFLCDTRTLVPAVRVETDNGTKSAEVTIRVKRRC